MSFWQVFESRLLLKQSFIRLKILNVWGKPRSQNIVPRCADPPRIFMFMFVVLNKIWIRTFKVKDIEVTKDAWRNRENKKQLVDGSVQIWDRTMIDSSMLPRFTSLDVVSLYHVPIFGGSPEEVFPLTSYKWSHLPDSHHLLDSHFHITPPQKVPSLVTCSSAWYRVDGCPSFPCSLSCKL